MTATITTTPTATTVIDSPAWAWTEYQDAVIDRADREFYTAHRTEIDAAAHTALSSALRQAWTAHGYDEVAEVPAHTFGELDTSTDLPGLALADEDDYLAIWETAITELEFTDLLEDAGLHRDYQEFHND